MNEKSVPLPNQPEKIDFVAGFEDGGEEKEEEEEKEKEEEEGRKT